MSASFYDLMKFAKTGIASPDMTDFDKRRALAAFGGYPVKTITGVPPISFKSDGSALIDVLIGGNMVQGGTPSPSSPIYPSETGDRTENLFDLNSTTSTHNCSISDGVITSVALSTSYGGVSIYLKTNLTAGTYYLSAKIRYASTDISRPWINKINLVDLSASPTPLTSLFLSQEFKTYTFQHVISSDGTSNGIFLQMGDRVSNTIIQVKDIMLSAANSAYVPYGYSIPLTLNNQTNPIYLSEPIRKIGDYADSAGLSIGGANRRIEKRVFNGTESFTIQRSCFTSDTFLYALSFSTPVTGKMDLRESINSHFQTVPVGINPQNVDYICSGFHPVIDFSNFYYFRVYMSDVGVTADNTDAEILDAFKQFLSDQYAAGTPVTVWYVLATPTTETITMPKITTTKGQNTLSIGTSLQPSSVSVTGHIK